MTEDHIEYLRDLQQTALISHMERSIHASDFEWAFELYSISLVLFSEKYNEALISVFQTLDREKIKNIEFERNIIGFTLEKIIKAGEVKDRITQAILDLIKNQMASVALRINSCILSIESENILPSIEPKFSEKVKDLIFSELKVEYDHAYSKKNWMELFRLYEMLKPVLPEGSLNHIEQVIKIAWQNISSEISVVINGKEIKEKIFSTIKNGVQFLVSTNVPGSIEIKSPFGSIDRRITDQDIFVKTKKTSFGIPFEQEKPTVVAKDKMIMMQVYPGLEKARILVTLKTD